MLIGLFYSWQNRVQGAASSHVMTRELREQFWAPKVECLLSKYFSFILFSFPPVFLSIIGIFWTGFSQLPPVSIDRRPLFWSLKIVALKNFLNLSEKLLQRRPISRLATLLEIGLHCWWFLVILRNFSEQLFVRIPPGDYVGSKGMVESKRFYTKRSLQKKNYRQKTRFTLLVI